MSDYTGLSCTFAYLIRDYGLDKIYDLVFNHAQNEACKKHPNYEQSDALSFLAAAISSDDLKDLEKKLNVIDKELKEKQTTTQSIYNSLIDIAEHIQYEQLDFSEFLEPKEHPHAKLTRRVSSPLQPVQVIQKKIEKLDGDKETDDQWYLIERFMVEEFPQLIENQLNLYRKFLSYDIRRVDDHPSMWGQSPYASLQVKRGHQYRLLLLKEVYQDTREHLSSLCKEITKYNSALENEKASLKLYEEARIAIEYKIPDDLGTIITNEKINEIREEAKNLQI